LKKQQGILLVFSSALLLVLFFFGRTVPHKTNTNPSPPESDNHTATTITTTDLINQSKTKLTPQQADRIAQLENSVVRGNVKEQQIAVYKQLTNFWRDTIHQHLLEAYYLGETAKLENSEKNITFAAHLFLEELLSEDDPALQNWLATNAKSLFEKSLQLNPANDSSKIGMGACYMFGNISNNPMEGISAIREVVEKNPDNIYGQMMLGLGGIRSGQYDKAIERFLIVAKKQPGNIEAVLHLAETYDRKGDKPNAITWYRKAGTMVAIPEAKRAIEERIKALK
jgi:tetratricopeptide (TPR) repeat protein